MTIPQSELQGLFQKFAAPLVNGKAATRFGEPVAKQLAQTFWRLMIDGPVAEDGLCHILLHSAILDQIHPVYRKRCERDDLHLEILHMDQEDLDPDLGESLPVEQPTNIQTKPLDINDQRDRIRAALGVTTDDAFPVVEKVTLLTYGEYLSARLTFPFLATFSDPVGPLRDARTIRVIGMSDTTSIEPEFGLVCKVQGDHGVWEMPLALLEVSEDNPNRQLLEDYHRWIRSWRDAALGRRTLRSHGHDDDPTMESSADGKTGRNAPCPCGSGRKFKKCCLKKPPGESIFAE